MLNKLRNKRCCSCATKSCYAISLYVCVLLLRATGRNFTAVALQINADLTRQFILNFGVAEGDVLYLQTALSWFVAK